MDLIFIDLIRLRTNLGSDPRQKKAKEKIAEDKLFSKKII